jgi:hypothetical protein
MSIAEHDVFELGEDDAQQRPGAFHDQRLARLVLCEQGLQFHEARHKPDLCLGLSRQGRRHHDAPGFRRLPFAFQTLELQGFGSELIEKRYKMRPRGANSFPPE